MRRKSALAVLVACCAALPATAWASSQADCAARWKSADGNNDGDGIWRGAATKDGKAVKVAIDFKGNVVSE